MQRKSRNLLVLLVAIVALGVWCLIEQQQSDTSSLTRVHMLDVGQGDSFLIQTTTGKQMLIDGGKDATVLAELARLLPVGDRSIDVVLATHPDMDHIGGLDEVLKRYKVGLFLTSAVGTDTKEYVSLLELLKAKQIEPIVARQGMKITFSDTESFTVLFPDRDVTGWESNSGSVIGVFAAGEQHVLFTGDAPASVEQYLVATIPKQLDVDIVKLGHHGSRTSTTAALLKAATPELALISAGKDNSYGHPHKEVLTLLQQFAIPFVSTQDTGTVTLETDGATWRRGEK